MSSKKKLTEVPKSFVGVKVRDFYTCSELAYPVTTPVRFKLDFVFSKDGNWWYINSFNEDSEADGQKTAVTQHGERWVCVDPKTGDVIKHG